MEGNVKIVAWKPRPFPTERALSGPQGDIVKLRDRERL